MSHLLSNRTDRFNALNTQGMVGPYTLIRRVGRGGMADVWLGLHELYKTAAAVKVLTPSEDQGDCSQKLLREVRAVAGLNHPYITDIFDFGIISRPDEVNPDKGIMSGAPWLAMEYAPHGDLAALNLPISWPALRRVLLMLLDALAHAHARHIIHLDIKPHNVLVRRTGREADLLLSDFGLAHFAEPEHGQPEQPILAGTPHYMSPEQLKGHWRSYGPWTDLYALGCMAFELATGRPPFDGNSPVEIARNHISSPVPDLPGWLELPKAFNAWLKRIMAKEPEERFERAADAAFQLARINPPTPDVEAEHFHALFQAADTEDDSLITHVLRATPSLQRRTTGVVTGSHTLMPLVTTTALKTGRNLPIPSIRGIDARRGLMEALPPQPNSWRAPVIEGETGDYRGLSLFGLRTLPFKGRIPERNHLWSALRWVKAQGRSRLVQIEGSSGAGKSALVRWLCERGEELGIAYALKLTHSASPSPEDGIAPGLLRCFGGKGSTRSEARDGVLAELDWLAPEMDGRDRMELAQSLSMLMVPKDANGQGRAPTIHRFSAVGRWLRVMARRRPVILWLDEVQWGADTLRLAHYLLRSETQAPVLIVATVTAEAQGAGRVESGLLKTLQKAPQAEVMPIAPLNAGMMTLMLEDGLGLESQTVEALLRRARGSTLYATQAVADWVERGALLPTARGYAVMPQSLEDLPDSLSGLALQRLWWVARRCPDAEGAIRVMEIAATLGRTVHMSTLTAASKRLGLTVPRQLLRLLLDRGLIRGALTQWTFAYEALRSVLLERARQGRRHKALHEACALSMRGGGEAGAIDHIVEAQRAFHLVEADRAMEALDTLKQAAEGWLTIGDHVRSITILERTIEILERETEGMANHDDLRMWVLSKLAESHHHLGHQQEAN
ncbi:MAG: protein kinase domain-containing protein, partial [Bradymonadia bacterium]